MNTTQTAERGDFVRIHQGAHSRNTGIVIGGHTDPLTGERWVRVLNGHGQNAATYLVLASNCTVLETC